MRVARLCAFPFDTHACEMTGALHFFSESQLAVARQIVCEGAQECITRSLRGWKRKTNDRAYRSITQKTSHVSTLISYCRVDGSRLFGWYVLNVRITCAPIDCAVRTEGDDRSAAAETDEQGNRRLRLLHARDGRLGEHFRLAFIKTQNIAEAYDFAVEFARERWRQVDECLHCDGIRYRTNTSHAHLVRG